MKKLIALLALALIVGCGGQARAASVDHIFSNVTGSTSTTRDISDLGKVSIQVKAPTFGNASSAVDIAVSADGGANYHTFKTYSATDSGIYDVSTNAPTHVKVTFRQKKKVHVYRTTTVNMNSK